MLNRLIKDESGMALGLAVIMILLIGVMGAGLLTFVQSDLSTVVKVNQGQKAFELADAGVQEARRHLLIDSIRQHYDMNGANDCTTGSARVGEDWSPNLNSRDCSAGGTLVIRATPGVTRNFAGGQFNVTIQCFVQSGESMGTAAPCSGVSDPSPEPSTPASSKTFFKITSTGFFPDNNGARRKVEAIVYRESLDLPLGYYTPRNIDFNGNVTVSGVSFFAGVNITGLGGGSMEVDDDGDPLLGNWNTAAPATQYLAPSNNNTQSRSKTDAGFAALGRVCKNSKVASCTAPPGGISYYDSSTATLRMVNKPDPNTTNAPGTISYPFNPAARPDLNLLMEEARGQGTYYIPTSGGFTIPRITNNGGGATPVVFVDYTGTPSTGNNVSLANEYDDDQTPAIIVVRNGNFNFSGASGDEDKDGDSEFRGVIIVVGNGSTTGNYNAAGKSELSGFVIADGDINLSGNAKAKSLLDNKEGALSSDFFARLSSFQSLKLWSWRELYQ